MEGEPLLFEEKEEQPTGEVQGKHGKDVTPVKEEIPVHLRKSRRMRKVLIVVIVLLALLLPLLLAVRQRLACEGSVLLVLDGPCAGGKSTAAALPEACTGATVFHMDDFFLPPEKRTAERLAQPGGNVDYERFLAEVLDKLPLQKALGYRAWDCHAQRLEPRIAPPGRLTIIEGAYALHPAFAARYGALEPICALVDVEPAVQLSRLTRRDPELLPRFQNEWIPLEKAYFEAYHIGERVRFRLRMGEGEP